MYQEDKPAQISKENIKALRLPYYLPSICPICPAPSPAESISWPWGCPALGGSHLGCGLVDTIWLPAAVRSAGPKVQREEGLKQAAGGESETGGHQAQVVSLPSSALRPAFWKLLVWPFILCIRLSTSPCLHTSLPSVSSPALPLPSPSIHPPTLSSCLCTPVLPHLTQSLPLGHPPAPPGVLSCLSHTLWVWQEFWGPLLLPPPALLSPQKPPHSLHPLLSP